MACGLCPRDLITLVRVIGGIYASDVVQYFRACLTRLAQFDTALETLEAEGEPVSPLPCLLSSPINSGELSFAVVLELKPHHVPAQAEKSYVKIHSSHFRIYLVS